MIISFFIFFCCVLLFHPVFFLILYFVSIHLRYFSFFTGAKLQVFYSTILKSTFLCGTWSFFLIFFFYAVWDWVMICIFFKIFLFFFIFHIWYFVSLFCALIAFIYQSMHRFNKFLFVIASIFWFNFFISFFCNNWLNIVYNLQYEKLEKFHIHPFIHSYTKEGGKCDYWLKF